MATPRPHILIVCHALSGHLNPLIRIASGLHHLGWTTSFLGPTAHRSRIEAAGCEFFPLTGDADLDDKLYYEQPRIPDYHSLPWAERGKIDLRLQCLEPLATQWKDFTAVLLALHKRYPSQRRQPQTIVLCEAFFLGAMPLKYGAELPAGVPAPRTVCVSVTVPALRSVDLPPFAHRTAIRPFDPSDAGRRRNAELWERRAVSARPLTELLDRELRRCGALRGVGEPFLAGANYRCHDTILQLGVPGFEYHRSDWPPNFRFAGLVQGVTRTGPAATQDPDFDWWDELKANSSLDMSDRNRKKVILVAQGTVEIKPEDLIIPTIEAFADREDILVVAVLGWKDARLSDYIKIPNNARIADYLSYDAALEHADVWVNNAGFGAVNHGIAHGVPMIVAGEGMDKSENAKRVAWSGIGIDLETAKPSVVALKNGIEKVFLDKTFTERVQLLKKQAEDMDCFGIIHQELLKMVD